MYQLKMTATAILLAMVGTACQKKANQPEQGAAAVPQAAEQKAELPESSNESGLMAMHTKPFYYTNDSGEKLSGVCFAYTNEALTLNPELKQELEPGDCPQQADIDVNALSEGRGAEANDLIKSCAAFGEADKAYGAIRVYSVSFDLKEKSFYDTSTAEAEALCTDLAPIVALTIKSE